MIFISAKYLYNKAAVFSFLNPTSLLLFILFIFIISWCISFGIDLVVTSQPYATALPYIDTDRLSLFFLNLIKKKERKSLEYEMVGNREITNCMRVDYERKLLKNDENLPKDVHQLIMKIKRKNDKSVVGFRKLNTAALLYKYFADMKIIMENVFPLLNKKGNFL